jgi:alpha-L-rhamnosidase
LEEAREYEQLADSIRDAFVRMFLEPATGKLFTGTQACQAFGLYFGMLPDDDRSKALGWLLKDIEEHKGHLTTGIFGTKYMLNALTEYGRADVAYAMATTKEFPGWGYMLENGATTLWETWKKEEFIYSHNHPMFGSVSEWLFKAIGGIKPGPSAVGFDEIWIEPQMVGDLTWAKASYQSVRGAVETDWKFEDGEFILKVRIPANSMATIRFRTSDLKSVLESDKPAGSAEGVTQIAAENGLGMYRVGSGRYTFRARR